MNKKGHVINAVLLSVAVGVVLEPSFSRETFRSIGKVMVPIVLGALLPDIDTVFGTHRKTFHNFFVLGIVAAHPFVFNNLYYVWIGVTTHYVLDLLGNVKGMALFYPYPGMFDIPVGVNVDSRWADLVTLLVTGFEIALIVLIARAGRELFLKGPGLSNYLTSFPWV